MNKFKIWLLKITFWGTNKKFIRVKKYRFKDGKFREIVLYSEKNPLFIGQSLAFIHTIIINSGFMKRYSKNVQQYVMEHEYAHARLNFLLSWPLTFFMILFGFIALTSFLSIILFGILAIFLHNVFNMLLLDSVISAVIFLILFSLLSWIEEFRADINAIKAIGISNMESANREMIKKRPKMRSYKRIISIITHPPRSLVIRIYKKLYV